MIAQQKVGESMELNDVMRTLGRNWLKLLACALVGGLIGLGVTFVMPPKYQSTTELYVSVRSGDAEATGDLVQGASFAQLAVTSYVDVSTSALVLEQVLEELDTDLTAEELEAALNVSSPSDSVLINITATSEDPQTAAAIASTTGNVFSRVVEEDIEGSNAGAEGPVQIHTIDPGTPPERPSSPNLNLNIALGTLVGLALGVAVVLGRKQLDTRIHSSRDVEQVTNAPVLGRFGHDAKISERPLIVHDDPHSVLAEAFRKLRTNLQFLGAGAEERIFVISSAVPGEGKTQVTTNLAIVLAESGARVTLVDGDLRKPKVADVMGLEGAVGLSDVLINRADLSDVVQPWGVEGLTVLASGQIPPNPSELLGSPAMRQVLTDLSENADYVLVDAPPLLPVTDAAVISASAAGTILVVAAERTKRPELAQAISNLDSIESRLLGIVLNGLPNKSSDLARANTYSYGESPVSR